MNKVKILATLGPACNSPARVRRLIQAGASGVRINLSHGDMSEYAREIRTVQRVSRQLGRSVSILLDLQGPKMRVGRFAVHKPVLLREGERWSLVTQAPTQIQNSNTSHVIPTTNFHRLRRMVSCGRMVLIDDGLIRLRVTSKRRDRIVTEVAVGGWLKEQKGINVPGARLKAPCLTAHDQEGLKRLLPLGVHYVAVSFVRHGGDLRSTRRLIHRLGFDVPIIAKIETQQALENLDEILEHSDGAMIARGDLGVELPIEQVPLLQKDIIRRANRADRLVITATQMLESMVTLPTPTRAEAADVANAVLDGSDVLMLSGETAIGRFPLEVVGVMRKMIETVEASPYILAHQDTHPGGHAGQASPSTALRAGSITFSLAHAACHAAQEAQARAIVVFTVSGKTATMVSKRRPAQLIIACTPDREVFHRMSLLWNVHPLWVDFGKSSGKMISNAERVSLGQKLLRSGDRIVIIARASHLHGVNNLIKIRTVGAPQELF